MDATMTGKPLRLLHAANLQLDCPLRTSSECADEIREIIDSATLTAFDRLITISIEKDVDALLITGNTFDAGFPSLTAEVALRDGFNRLAERQIPVFIAPGRIDPAAAWQELPRLPHNVTIFIDTNVAPVDLTDHGHLLATVLPVTSETSIEPEELTNILGGRTTAKGERPFVVGLLLTDRSHEKTERPKLSPTRYAALDWLACPAGTDTELLPLTDGQIHSQGAPQGMSLQETGLHGATLLEVDSHRKTRLSPIPLAPVRWERLTQAVDNASGHEDLLGRMLTQFERLPHQKGELVRIIDWHLDRTTGDANGWEIEAAATALCRALTEISDRPDGLRCIHRVHSLELDLSLVEPGHREVLTEYLLALDRRAPDHRVNFAKWIADARVGDVLKAERWEHWSEVITPEQVTERAKQLGWKWFSTIGKK
jgi:exonuclease SbcD